MKKKNIIFVSLMALILLSGIYVQPVLAFFTASVSAVGIKPLDIGPSTTEIEESGSNDTKEIVVKNTGDYPVIIRVRVISPESVSVKEFSGIGWNKDNSYYYFDNTLNPGESTEVLKVVFDTEGNVNKEDETSYKFNVVVVQEAARVYADGSVDSWDMSLTYENAVGGE